MGRSMPNLSNVWFKVTDLDVATGQGCWVTTTSGVCDCAAVRGQLHTALIGIAQRRSPSWNERGPVWSTTPASGRRRENPPANVRETQQPLTKHSLIRGGSPRGLPGRFANSPRVRESLQCDAIQTITDFPMGLDRVLRPVHRQPHISATPLDFQLHLTPPAPCRSSRPVQE